MIRTLILMFFTYFFFHLHASGNITKYINMKYSYLSISAIVILGILMIVQAVTNYITEEKKSHDQTCCNHDHHSEKQPIYKKVMLYTVFIFPLFTGFFLPVATLDSNIVKTKGFAFKAIDTSDEYAQTQYLKPDTSIYYGIEGYEDLMDKELKKYVSRSNISLNDTDFLKGMETIYKFPGDFIGKQIEFDGFAFKGEAINKQQMFVLRFGIIHCIADSGVFGMLVEFPHEAKFKDDEWLHVKGTLSTVYYQPFKSKIPVLHVEEYSTIAAPKDPYVYRGS
jgi:putative membrane protein